MYDDNDGNDAHEAGVEVKITAFSADDGVLSDA